LQKNEFSSDSLGDLSSMMQAQERAAVPPSVSRRVEPLRQRVRNFLGGMFSSIERSVQYSGPKFTAVGALTIVGFPLYYFIWHDLFPQPYENLPLRLVGAALFVPLLLVPWWPRALRRFLPIYWYVAILYALPFFFTFMYLKNDGSQVWAMSTLTAVFLMILLVDWRNLIAMITLGVACAWLTYYLTSDLVLAPVVYWADVAIYLFAIVAGSVFNVTTERIKQEKLRAILAAASNIAHELRTPLLGVKSAATGLGRYLPVLLDAYQQARHHGLKVAEIRTAHYEAMVGSLARIEQEAEHSNTIIDMLLINSRQEKPATEGFGSVSMARCIDLMLARYPFSSPRERERVNYNRSADFSFVGSELLMVHVFFNLMKNALRSVARTRMGEIRLWLLPGEEQNAVYFRDTGMGIPENVLPHIFQRFYSWSTNPDGEQGTGVGLAFCKTIIESFGGRITCRSTSGAFVEFVMTFPVEQRRGSMPNTPVLFSDDGNIGG
jgi:signal transduction histidine kinase